MPQAAPPPMPQAAPPAMQPGMQPQPCSPWAAGPDSTSAPPAMPQPGMTPPGLPTPGHVEAQPPVDAPKLEHVSDFFADETLGFEDDGSHIETAGPGRLTILGFVPKSTGSIRTTIIVALVVFAVAFVVIAWQTISAKNTRRIAKLYGEVRQAMDEDKFARYQDALRTGQEILKIDASHNLTLSAMAYAEAVLATDHAKEGSIDRAKDYLRRAIEADDKETEFRVAAKALLALNAKKYDEGIADARRIIEEQGGASPLLETELFRLMQASKPGDPQTELQLRKTKASVVNQARIYNILGWHYYENENWQQADQFFDQAQQNSRGHPGAMIGQALTDLGRGIALKERQKEIATQVKKVFALPKDELSQPILAKAHFARAMLEQWQEKTQEAEADFDKAYQLDPNNALFHHRRGVQQLKLRQCAAAVKSLKKAAALDPNNCAYYKRLGEAQTCNDQPSDAKASYDRARQLCPKDTSLMLLEGERLFAAKKYDEAVEAFKKIRRDDGGVVFSRAQMGISRALREAGKKAQANKHMEKFFEDVPGAVKADLQAELWCELGQTYEALKNKEQALQAYTVGIEQYPYYADCHWYVCRLMKRGPEAKEACKRYLTVDPKGRYKDRAEKIVNR
jgi:tetratricopeptide (TPR) repeat protein